MSENVIKLVNKFSIKCRHSKFLIDESLALVECGICGEKLNPIWVLSELSKKEHRLYQSMQNAKETADKADQKNKCKCEHCQKITRISR